MREPSGVDCFRDKQVLITGGLGFLGSNLAIRLVALGARVTLLDAMVEDHGGNLFNIEPIKDRVTINFSDVRDEFSLKYLVRGKDYHLPPRRPERPRPELDRTVLRHRHQHQGGGGPPGDLQAVQSGHSAPLQRDPG